MSISIIEAKPSAANAISPKNPEAESVPCYCRAFRYPIRNYPDRKAMMRTQLSQSERQSSSYRWVMLAMVTISGFVTMGFPTTGLSALFSEIADSLGLDLVQIGLVWGVGTVMGIFTTLMGGAFIDHFGTRRSLVVLCLATGISGALRGFAVDFWSLFLFSFLFGMV